ncbi:unnamed protein product, partial [Effrenium voratum]
PCVKSLGALGGSGRARLGLAAQEAWEDLWNLRISSQAADRFVAGFLLLTRSASLCLLGLRQASCPHVCLQRGIGRPGHKIDEWQIGRTATTWTLTGPSEYIPTPVIISALATTCAALSKAYFEPQEHADLLGPDGMPRGACKRQGSPDARGTQSSITFTASGTSPEACRAGDNLQGMQTRMVGGDWNFSTLSPIPRKRLQSESPRQDEVPSAGKVSTRFSWAADMVPHSPQPKRNMRNMQSLESASPRSLIRSSAALTTGFYAEEPDTLLDSFLGARKGRSPFASPSPGASPLTSPRSVSATPQSRGFGSLSWGHVSAGGYGPEVAARQAAGTSHRLWRPKDSDITTFKARVAQSLDKIPRRRSALQNVRPRGSAWFLNLHVCQQGSYSSKVGFGTQDEPVTAIQEPFLRHRERVRDQRARSPPRWK